MWPGYPDIICYKKQQHRKDAHGDINGLSQEQVPRRQLKNPAVGCLEGLEYKATDNRQHQKVNGLERTVGVRIDNMGFHPLPGYKRYDLVQFVRQQLCNLAGPAGMGEKQILNQIEYQETQGGKRNNRH